MGADIYTLIRKKFTSEATLVEAKYDIQFALNDLIWFGTPLATNVVEVKVNKVSTNIKAFDGSKS